MKKSFFTLSKNFLKAEPTTLQSPLTSGNSINAMTIDDARKAIAEVKTLCDTKQWAQALKKIDEINVNFPNTSKALWPLKGQARKELLREEDQLPNFEHLDISSKSHSKV